MIRAIVSAPAPIQALAAFAGLCWIVAAGLGIIIMRGRP